jgi:hypothetical protein
MTADAARLRQLAGDPLPSAVRRFNSPHPPTPRTNLLSNGRGEVEVG